MKRLKSACIATALTIALSACGGGLWGGAVAPVAVAVSVPGPSGLIGGPLGAGLNEKDRMAASDAQLAAVTNGQKRTWRGAQGSFGFIDPGPETLRAEGSCRDYTHKVYMAGRAQSGQGLACRVAGRGWVMVK